MDDDKNEIKDLDIEKITTWAKEFNQDPSNNDKIKNEIKEYTEKNGKEKEYTKIISEVIRARKQLEKEALDILKNESKQYQEEIIKQEKKIEQEEKDRIKEEKNKILQEEKTNAKQERERIRQEKRDKYLEKIKKLKNAEPEETAENLALTKVEIMDVFTEDELNQFKQQNNGTLRGPCPQCGPGSGGSDPFILFPETNYAHCHKTGCDFNILETIALKHGIIDCSDGRNKDEGVNETPLKGDVFKEVLDVIEAEYGKEFLNRVTGTVFKKLRVTLPEKGKLISIFSREVGDILKDKNFLYYRPDAKCIVEIKKIKEEDFKKDYFTGFDIVEQDRFITLLERFITPMATEIDRDGNAIYYPKSLTPSISKTVLSSPDFQDKLPTIERVFTTPLPIIWQGKLCLPDKGYDKRFKSYLPYNAPEITNLNMDIEEAKALLLFTIKECSFKTKQDVTNALAAIITPFLRGLFTSFNKRTPVFFYIANRERAGKDYLAGIGSLIYEGFVMEEPPISHAGQTAGAGDEELRKKLLSAFINGKKRLHFANNKGHLDNSVFEAVVTNEKFSDRLLGRNQTLCFDNELDISCSGNIGITYTPDFANRCRFIKLFLNIEDANSRIFENPNLHEWIKNNRSNLLSALYALVREWYEKGKPKSSKPFASFPEWADVCGGILECNGLGNPCHQDKDSLIAIGGDAETYDMKRLFEICYETYGNNLIKRDDIISTIMKTDDIFHYIDWEKKSDRVKFGIRLAKFVGRILSDISLIAFDGDRASRQLYKFSKSDKVETFNIVEFFNENNEEKIQNNERLARLATFNDKENETCERLIEFGTENKKNEKKEAKDLFNFNEKSSENHFNSSVEKATLLESTRTKDLNSNTSDVLKASGQVGQVGYLTPVQLCTEKINIKRDLNNNTYNKNINNVLYNTPGWEVDKGSQPSQKTSKKDENKPVSDREIQYWESPECKDIVAKVTKEEVYEFLKNNNGISTDEAFEKIGLGFFKHLRSLLLEEKIKRDDTPENNIFIK